MTCRVEHGIVIAMPDDGRYYKKGDVMLTIKLEPIKSIKALDLQEIKEFLKDEERISFIMTFDGDVAYKLKMISCMLSCPMSGIILGIINEITNNKGFIESVNKEIGNERN